MKKCFVICPFGSADSEIRERSTYIFNLISQAVNPRGYECYRTIDDPAGGQILNQVISEIRGADLVVADLTNLNPNVMYELALRHVTGKPYIHLVQRGTKMPFDISIMNYIEIDPDFKQGDETLNLIRDIGLQVDKIEQGKCNFSNAAIQPMGDLLVQYFIWEVSFVGSLHRDWLDLQDDHIQDFIRDYGSEGVDLAKSSEFQRKKLAEYQAMNDRANSVMRGNLFYFFSQKSRSIIEGWVVFDETKPTLTIDVRGEHYDDRIHLRYTQPAWPQPIKGEEVKVGPYNYDIVFECVGGEYSGMLVHPDEFRNGATLKVADTHLIRHPGLVLSDR